MIYLLLDRGSTNVLMISYTRLYITATHIVNAQFTTRFLFNEKDLENKVLLQYQP